jgi:hypothetical protein
LSLLPSSRAERDYIKKKNYASFLRRLFMPRLGRSGSPSPTRPPPYLRHRLPPRRLTIHQFLRRLRAQHYRIVRLIGVYGPLHRVRYSLSRHPDVPLESALQDCLGLQDIFVGDLVSLDAPPFRFCFTIHPPSRIFLVDFRGHGASQRPPLARRRAFPSSGGGGRRGFDPRDRYPVLPFAKGGHRLGS